MFPETILEGKYKIDSSDISFSAAGHAFAVEYDAELAIAGLPPYYVHRERRKGDKMKNQRTVSELPIPEPHVTMTYRSQFNEDYFADVVIVETFEEAVTFLGKYFTGYDTNGSFVDDMLRFIEEHKHVERDAQIAREDERRDWDASKDGSQQYLF